MRRIGRVIPVTPPPRTPIFGVSVRGGSPQNPDRHRPSPQGRGGRGFAIVTALFHPVPGWAGKVQEAAQHLTGGFWHKTHMRALLASRGCSAMLIAWRFSVRHSTVGRSTHAAGTAGAHVGYITRAGACRPSWGTHADPEGRDQGRPARVWLDEQEAGDRKTPASWTSSASPSRSS